MFHWQSPVMDWWFNKTHYPFCQEFSYWDDCCHTVNQYMLKVLLTRVCSSWSGTRQSIVVPLGIWETQMPFPNSNLTCCRCVSMQFRNTIFWIPEPLMFEKGEGKMVWHTIWQLLIQQWNAASPLKPLHLTLWFSITGNMHFSELRVCLPPIRFWNTAQVGVNGKWCMIYYCTAEVFEASLNRIQITWKQQN